MQMDSSCGRGCTLDSNSMSNEQDTCLHSPKLQKWNLKLDDEIFNSMSALQILRETVRVLRSNSVPFMSIAALLICPVSAIYLSGVLVHQSLVERLSLKLLLIAQSSGLPLTNFIKESCEHLSEQTISSIFSLPLAISFSMISKSGIVYYVACTYAGKNVNASKFFETVCKIWKRIVSTYLLVWMVLTCCLALFLVVLLSICSAFSILVLPSEIIVYPAIFVAVVFSVIFSYTVIICNLAIVISVLEDVNGAHAFLRSALLIKGRTQVGIVIFLGSTLGMTFVQELFDHRVKTLSYGDGSSRIWEGPLLVIMYSFLATIDSMMNAIFYFSCRTSNIELSLGKGDDISLMSSSKTMLPE